MAFDHLFICSCECIAAGVAARAPPSVVSSTASSAGDVEVAPCLSAVVEHLSSWFTPGVTTGVIDVLVAMWSGWLCS